MYLNYKDQPINNDYGYNHCLFWASHERQKQYVGKIKKMFTLKQMLRTVPAVNESFNAHFKSTSNEQISRMIREVALPSHKFAWPTSWYLFITSKQEE